MSWDVAYKAGPPGGALSTILDYATMVRITNEWSLGYRGSDPMSQYKHGEDSSPRKFMPSANFNVECTIRDTNAAGLIIHADGAPGHRLENFSTLKSLFAGTQGKLVRLERTMPDTGTTYIDCWQVGTAMPTQNRMTYAWPMRAPRPFWIGSADLTNATPIFTVAGDAPIDDAILDFTGGSTDSRLTHDDTGDWIEIAGVLPAGGVRVDIGAGTCVKITGGADYSNNLRVSTPWWMELDPGANGVTVSQTAGVAVVTADWYTKWR